MIVRQQPTFFQLFYTMRGSVIPQILPHLLLTMAFSIVVVGLHRTFPHWLPSLTGLPLALLGMALSIFLGFRNNACYDRWWEARKQWGEMISVCRTLARQTGTIDDGSVERSEDRRALLRDAIQFVHALALHVRPEHPSEPSRPEFDPRLRADLAQAVNRPDAILRGLSDRLARLRRQGVIGDVMFQTFDRSVAQLGGIQAACERLRNTPLPYAYTLLLHRTAYVFCFLFPLGFADTLGWFTPFGTLLVAYTFFGLDALSVELERPFSADQNAMPLSAMARIIEISLLDAMGETDLPPALSPVDFVLS